MIWHPSAIAVFSGDLLGLLLLSMSALTAFYIILHWSPADANRGQLKLERNAEAAAIRTRWASVLFAFATLVFLIGITHWFVDLVPGAMCGTGVIQSMGAEAAPALLFRGLLIWLLLLWNVFEKLNQSRPDQPISRVNARILLCATPVALLAAVTTYQSLRQVDLYRPVDCCAVVYDQFRTIEDAHQTAGISDAAWIIIFTALSVLLAVTVLRTRRHPTAKRTGLAAVVAVFWIPAAAITLVNVLAAYHYQVLQHQCPWCLFLPEHRRVGYLLFGALAVIAFESSVIWAMPKISSRFRVLAEATIQRQRTAAGRVLLALAVFLILAGLPPILWRLRYGVWMGG